MRASDDEGRMLESAVGLSGFWFFFPSPKASRREMYQTVIICSHIPPDSELKHCVLSWTGWSGKFHIQACNEGAEPCEMNVLIH